MLKNVYHRRYMIRAQAAKAMLAMGYHDELEKLLDGLIDYRYWFGMGKNPVKTKDVTPGMLESVRRMLSDPESEIGSIIVAGLKDSVQESEIKDGLRTPERAYNVMQAAKVSLERAPETAIAVAEMIRQRVDSFDTSSLVTLVGTPNSGARTPSNGLYPSLDSLKGEKKEALTDLLYDAYRKEFIARLKQQGRPYNQALVDTLIDLTQLRDEVDGWQPLGQLKREDRTWQFTTFDPLSEKDEMHPRERKRFRRIQLEEQLQDWFTVDYGNMEYHKKTKEPAAQMDLYIEGLRLSDILGDYRKTDSKKF